MFKVTKYKNFNPSINIDKIITFLGNGDFKSAETKKLQNLNLFRAKINYEDRLIFGFFKHHNQNYILLLEMVLNHDYNKSQFLRGKKVEIEDFVFDENKVDEVFYVDDTKEFRYLDKVIVFSDKQEYILIKPTPLLIIGSAGSGKTSVVIEKLKTLEGKCLYISLSEHLVKNSQKICGEVENIDFYSFQSFLNSIERQSKEEIDFNSFKNWAYKNGITDVDKYFEEFKGVLTASNENAYLSEDEYLAMGVKQSLFLKDERKKVYKIFERYIKFLENQNFYDSNILIFNLFAKVEKIYDYIIIDEVQDFTNKEIYFILLSLKNANNFILSGDANQIVYSNFFSWSNLKTMLFKEAKEQGYINEVLKQNYRNSKDITKIS
ncbi:MAG: UvrD-helicase domain-containing protein, partial [Sulfurovum sp.]|nr:UvrD-helicase domain-containing protein [Sulfurovum sp.]